VLTAEDDFKAMDFYQNLGEGTLSVVEQLRLKSHELAKLHPELWNETLTFPNRIYSGKSLPESANGHRPTANRYLFLCYRIVTGYDPENPDAEPTRDAKWVMIDRETGEITKEERTKLRKQVEGDLIEQIRFRSQIPVDYKDELVCWMEIG
jgi:hypothetical protein